MFVVAQLGARRHYDVARIFSRAGLLERLYTDIYAPLVMRALLGTSFRFAPGAFRRCLGRAPDEVLDDRITSFPAMGLEYLLRQKQSRATGQATAAYLWAGRELCRRVILDGLRGAQAVYTFNSAGLELLQFAHSRGLLTVLEQTSAPAAIEDELLQAEAADYPNWESPRVADPHRGEFQDRERMEWEGADVILCGSEFVRAGIQSCGGPVERCSVVPYGVDFPIASSRRDFGRRKLRVITVGAVGLGKGAPYILAAAKSLKKQAGFRMAGHINITSHARALLSRHVELLGVVPRSEIHSCYEGADVFLLPSVSEGSAGVCYEALAAGLPVITTPNAGSVVRDGIDGFIVPIRSPEAIIEKLDRLASDPDLLAFMSKNARERSADYTLERYGERLLSNVIPAVAQ